MKLLDVPAKQCERDDAFFFFFFFEIIIRRYFGYFAWRDRIALLLLMFLRLSLPIPIHLLTPLSAVRE
jgi:hypothetical protein